MSETRALPQATAWSAPYWAAARKHQLIIQCCADCDKFIMYPKRFCPFCLGENLDWKPASGRGEVYSVTVQRAAAPSGFEADLPYTLAIIRLAEGVQMMSRLVGDRAEQAQCGDAVTVDFQDVPDTDVTLPVFRLATASERGKSS